MNELVTLTSIELQRLTDLEAVVERGQQTFKEVGEALAEIRDSELYKQTHWTFDDYCKDQWGWTKQNASLLIRASVTVDNLSRVLDSTPPTSVNQITPLTSLDSDQQHEAWCKAHEIAEEEGKPAVTGEIVKRVVDEMKGKEKNIEARKKNKELNAMSQRASQNSCAGRAISCLRDINLKAEGAAEAFDEVIKYCRQQLSEI